MHSDCSNVWRLPLVPMPVRRGDDGAIWQYLNPGIGTVPTMCVVSKPNPVLPGPPLLNVIPGANPPNPIALRQTLVGCVTKRDEQTTIIEILARVPIPRERSWQLARRRPGCTFVITEDHE